MYQIIRRDDTGLFHVVCVFVVSEEIAAVLADALREPYGLMRYAHA